MMVNQFTAGFSRIHLSCFSHYPGDMKLVKTVCVLLVCLSFLISKGDCQVNLLPGGKVRVCGTLLTKTMQNLCVNGFYTNVKKSGEYVCCLS